MGLKEFKIHFDNPDATYYPDQTVTGKVILTLDSIKKTKGKKIYFWLIFFILLCFFFSFDEQFLEDPCRYWKDCSIHVLNGDFPNILLECSIISGMTY